MSEICAEEAKQDVLMIIADSDSYIVVKGKGRAKFLIKDKVVHVRFCRKPGNAGYSFNINKNTLMSDYELWICGPRAPVISDY